MMTIDYALTRFLNSLAGNYAALDLALIAITNLGPFLLVGLIAIRWWSRDNRIPQRHLAIGCGLATALGLLFNQIILLVYQRPRPYESGLTHLLVEKSADPSFPSDHATVAFAIVAYLFLARDRRRLRFLAVGMLVCFSRIFVGIHFVSDVLGGAFTGAVAAFAVTILYMRLDPITYRLVKIA